MAYFQIQGEKRNTSGGGRALEPRLAIWMSSVLASIDHQNIGGCDRVSTHRKLPNLSVLEVLCIHTSVCLLLFFGEIAPYTFVSF